MFRVEWHPEALDDLTTVWIQSDADARQAITAASHEVDNRLGNDPRNEGESRQNGRRITFVPPLAVDFQIEADENTVTVLQVRMFHRRPR